jgi:hypothetical protein
MDQLKSTFTTSMNVRVDVPTKARATRIQRITNKSLPQLLETMFRLSEERHILPRLNPEEREAYFTGKLTHDEYTSILARAIREEDRGTKLGDVLEHRSALQ